MQDYLISISTVGWQSFAVAIFGGIGALFVSLLGSAAGAAATAEPRRSGELSYLLIAGRRTYRAAVLRRTIGACLFMVGICVAMLVSTLGVGAAMFGGGAFQDLLGRPISTTQANRIVAHSFASLVAVGLMATTVSAAIGVRASVQAAVAAGITLFVVEPLVGSIPGVGALLRATPFGHYTAWGNKVVPDLVQGSTTRLYVLATAWLLGLVAVGSTFWFARPPRTGEISG